MEAHIEDSLRDPSHEVSTVQFTKTHTKDYQDEAESRDSKWKTIWDGEMGDLKNTEISYRKAVALLLSWHEDVDDLHTNDEVTKLDDLFRNKFHYETRRKILNKDPRRSAQAQVNMYLAEFVYEYDDTNTLLIIYYAGHGSPGKLRGTLNLAGSKSLQPEDRIDLDWVGWSSAEQNIQTTRGDVLVIFDCCHAGEWERSVRPGFSSRAFEFLAATSANSTTRGPGIHSFTSALIWSLSYLAESCGKFSTQELIRTIHHHAPNFPRNQHPRLCERPPACLHKIVLTPLNSESRNDTSENIDREDDDDDTSEEMRQDLRVRFVFDKKITDHTVKELASGLARLIRDNNINSKAVLWEGVGPGPSHQFPNPFVQLCIHRWMEKSLSKRKNKGSEASPTAVPKSEISPPTSSTPSGSGTTCDLPAIDGSSVTRSTSNPSRSIVEAEIYKDQRLYENDITAQNVHNKNISLSRKKRASSTLETLTIKKCKGVSNHQ